MQYLVHHIVKHEWHYLDSIWKSCWLEQNFHCVYGQILGFTLASQNNDGVARFMSDILGSVFDNHSCPFTKG